MSQTLSEILSSKIPGIRANGINKTLTGLSASTSNDNIIASLPSGHGIEIGDIIELAQSANVQFINYRIYGRRVIEIQNDSFNYIQETDVVPVGLNGTYDLEITIDGGSPTNISFNIVGGTDTWADVIVAVNAGLSTAGLAATAFFNSPSTLWPGGVSNAQAGILIRSNTLGSGSSVNDISPGTSNDFYSGLSTINYSYSINSADASGVNFDLAISAGFTFSASTYSVSGPIYNGTFTVIAPVLPGVAIVQTLIPDLFSNGYTTQDSSNLSALTANHSMVGGSISGTVSVSNANDVTYVGTPVTIATISTIDVIKKHYINNGNIGIGTQNPQYPLDILKDMYYKGNKFPKCNFEATGVPSSSDDITQGYQVGSLWTYNGQLYICENANSGNANWIAQLTSAVSSVNGDSGPSVTLTTDDIGEGSNLYYTDTRFDNRLSAKTTDDLPEGATNKYFSGKTTDDLSEGVTNLYFSEQRTRDTVLTGYSQSAGSLQATDTVLQALSKLGSLKSGLISKQISTGAINKGEVVRVITNSVEKYSRGSKDAIVNTINYTGFSDWGWFYLSEGIVASFQRGNTRSSNSTSEATNAITFSPSNYASLSMSESWGCEILPGKFLISDAGNTIRLIDINTASQIASQTISGASGLIITYLKEGAFLLSYYLSGSTTCEAVIGTTDGSSITLNTPSPVVVATITPNTLCTIDANFVLLLARSSSNYYVYAIKINLDGTTIDSITEIIDIVGTASSNICDIIKINENFFAFTHPSSGDKYIKVFELNKSAPSATQVQSAILSGLQDYWDTRFVHLEKNMYLLASGKSESGSIWIDLKLIKFLDDGSYLISPKVISATYGTIGRVVACKISHKTVYVQNYGLIYYDYDKFIINDGEWYPNNLYIAENSGTSPNNILLRHFGNLTDMPSNTYKAGLKYTVSDSGALVPITGNIEMDYPKLALAVSDTELLVYSK